LIHGRLFESTSCTTRTAESCRAFDFLGQEVADIYTQSAVCPQYSVIVPGLANAAVFATNEPPRYTATLDIVARVQCRVVVVANLPSRFTRVKRAVERFDLSRPELEVTGSCVVIAREGNLWGPIRKHIQNLAVYVNGFGCETWKIIDRLTGNVTKLVIVEHCFSPLVT
jgi:hypothetical protein